MEGEEAGELTVVRPVEVGGAGGEEGEVVAVGGEEVGLVLGVGDVEGLDAVDPEGVEAVDR